MSNGIFTFIRCKKAMLNLSIQSLNERKRLAEHFRT